METRKKRFICDTDGCESSREEYFAPGDLPSGWTRIVGKHLCAACSRATQKPWHDDLCVEVTLADVVDRGTLRFAVGAASHNFYTHHGIVSDFIASEFRSRQKTAIDTVTGIVTNQDIDRSPHSIVRLICPSFAEACEHPVEFMAMYHAAIATHSKLSDVDEMVSVCQKIDSICNAVKEASSLRARR